MKRVRLDDIPQEDIHAIADMQALARTNYAGSLRIVKLTALLSVAMQIEISLASQPESRANSLARKLAAVHVSGIKKRIAQVAAINERKASKSRRERTIINLADLVSDANSLTRITKLAPAQGLPPIAPIERAKIAAPIIADLKTPSTDEQYEQLIDRMNRLSESGAKPEDTAYGSPEDWIK